MVDEKKTPKGSRKLRTTLIHGVYLLAGLGMCLWMEAPDVYKVFAAFCVGNQGVFTWGNVKEHQAETEGERNGRKKDEPLKTENPFKAEG